MIAMQDNVYKRRKLAVLAALSAAVLLIATGLAAMYAGVAFSQAYIKQYATLRKRIILLLSV